MRALRFVGPGDDANHVVVETADGAERFVLPIDAALRDLARTGPPGTAAAAPRVGLAGRAAGISPREIQMRARAGASAQELADEHDMTIESVLRFAGPVIAERVRIADEARRARARRSTTEGQTVVFGDAVDERFSAHGIDPATVTWNSYRRDDGQWVVTAGWIGGEADRLAEWAFHLATRTVTALDETAADLLSDRPIRPALIPLDGPVRPSLVSAPPLVRGVVAFPPMPDAETGPLPSAAELDQVFDQDALDADAPREDVDYHAALLPLRLAEAADAPDGSETAEGEPSVAAEPAELAKARTARLPKVTNLGVSNRETESEEDKAARARIPSWDDILLGVRRKGD
ncbi:MAG: septation protein SepH [Actinomycetota bacterium]|nr:septation protein SepH [Actinomycetota bacterium]